MSNDEMMKMMMEMGRGVFTNVIVQVSANSLPEDAANMMGNFMNMLESEAFEHYINTTLASVRFNFDLLFGTTT